jgi:hypothetical protein
MTRLKKLGSSLVRQSREENDMGRLAAMICGAVCVTMAMSAESRATIDAVDPFGDAPSTAIINEDPEDHSLWVSWQNKNTGQCAFTFLSSGDQLFDDVRVFGFGGNDTLTFAPSSSGPYIHFCGFPISPPAQEGFRIYLYGGDGNDILGGPGEDYWAFGQNGNDILKSNRADSMMLGGAGDDQIVMSKTSSIFFSGGIFDGEAGNDCLAIPKEWSPASQACGSGTDRWSGPGAKPADCEIYDACCSFVPC